MATPNDIYNEITRIDNAKQGIAEAIEEKGVQVPDGTPIQDFPEKVRQIQQGSPDAVLYTPQELTLEQQAQARQNIGAGTYTKPNTGIPATDFSQGVQTSLEKANTAVQPDALTPITDLIPEQATPQNQLADKNFVNSSVATNTANYISDNGQPFQSLADLEAYTGTLTNNDYAFVVGTDSAGNTTYTRYKYNATTGEWAEEYVLNNSSFTAEQWAAISSGITALLVQKLSELPTEIVTYVAQTLTEAQKQQARQNIGATAPEIFWAEYGVTTAQEIETNLSSNKLVCCLFNGYTYILNQISATHFIFYCVVANYARRIRVQRSNNVWGDSVETMELITNKSQSIETDRESTYKYPSVKAVFDSLGKWGVISQTQTWRTPTGQPRTYTMDNLVYGIIPHSFIVQAENEGATFNETTGYFELNDLPDISYKEMLNIFDANALAHHFIVGGGAIFRSINMDKCPRTICIPNYTGSNINASDGFRVATQVTGQVSKIETISIGTQQDGRNFTATNLYQLCYGCQYLRKVGFYNGVRMSSASTDVSLIATNCFSLEEFNLLGLAKNIGFNACSALKVSSIAYMVDNAANTTAITMALHATAYARCQADTTEYEYNGQTYTGIIAYAAAKNITIASA